jgi:hypothetical protein
MRNAAWIALLLAGLLSILVDRGILGRPIPPDLTRLPEQLGSLHLVETIPIPPEALGEYPPERYHFGRWQDTDGRSGLLYLAWYQRGRRWSGRPHATEYCFRADGWRDIEGHRLRRSDGQELWSRRFEREERQIRVLHWLEQPGRGRGESLTTRIANRVLPHRESALRQDMAAIYWEFETDACPSEEELIASSEAVSRSLRELWNE